MGYYISLNGGYHEGDLQWGDMSVPQRPTPTCTWTAGAWVDMGPSIAQQRAAILIQLQQLDSDSMRPLRAVSAGTALDTDTQKIAALESQALALRVQLSALN